MTATTTTVATEIVAEILSGDWSRVSADALTEILAHLTELGEDHADFAGLSDRIETGPTHWTMACTMDGDGTEESIKEPCDLSDAQERCESWLADGEWTPESIVTGMVYPDGLESGDYHAGDVSATIDPEPEPECPESESGHEWTSEFEGGCTENPGVWSTGGTRLSFSAHCRCCGMSRKQVSVGSQRNPGEHDTTEYGAPDAEWVADHIEA